MSEKRERVDLFPKNGKRVVETILFRYNKKRNGPKRMRKEAET